MGSNNALPIDHLRVERALPAAVNDCLGSSAQAVDSSIQARTGLAICSGGLPLYTFQTLDDGWPAEPEQELRIELTNEAIRDPFLLEISGPQLERVELRTDSARYFVQPGSVLVFERCDEQASESLHNKKMLLIHSTEETFRATRQRATLGRCQWTTFDNQTSIWEQQANRAQ